MEELGVGALLSFAYDADQGVLLAWMRGGPGCRVQKPNHDRLWPVLVHPVEGSRDSSRSFFVAASCCVFFRELLWHCLALASDE